MFEMEDHWCLSLACHLSKYCDSEDEMGNSVTEMGDTLGMDQRNSICIIQKLLYMCIF